MGKVGICVKANYVRAEHALQELGAPRQNSKDFRRREWNVKEEPDARVWYQPAQETRNQRELIIVNPNEVAGVISLRNRVGKSLINVCVGLPVSPRVSLHLIGEVMEERPEYSVGETFIVAADFSLRELNGNDAKLGEILFDLSALTGIEARNITGPSDPQ